MGWMGSLTDSARRGVAWLWVLVISALPPPRAVVVGGRRFEIRSGEGERIIHLLIMESRLLCIDLSIPPPVGDGDVGDGDRFWSPVCWLDGGVCSV